MKASGVTAVMHGAQIREGRVKSISARAAGDLKKVHCCVLKACHEAAVLFVLCKRPK